jgi:proteasome lid subunit RPN8/RPN11
MLVVSAAAYYVFVGVPEFLEPEDEPAKVGEIRFSVEQIEEINDVYQRSELEKSWCMDIDGYAVSTIKNPKQEKREMNRNVAQCSSIQGEVDDGVLHTHPDGTQFFTTADLKSPFNFTCMVHGVVEEEPSESVQSIRCVHHEGGPESTAYEELPVQVRSR